MKPARRAWAATHWKELAALAVVLVVVLFFAFSRSSSPVIGYDVSYPQCSSGDPSTPLFGIVGVNGGTARTANPCVSRQIHWALHSRGQRRPSQPRLSLYIDTGNPGSKSTVWPSSGNTPDYGTCTGLLTNACSYLYGEQRAIYSYGLVAAISPTDAKAAPWWLDVELLESWAGTYQLNIAALKGFVAGLRNAGVTGPIGIYSTAAQWQEITGLTAQTTTAAFGVKLRGWVAGTGLTLTQAQRNCSAGDFTGQAPTLAQYQRGRFDANLRCAGGS